MMAEEKAVEKGVILAWRCWLTATACFVALTALTIAVGGLDTLKRCGQSDPLSITAQTFACTGLIWLAFGIALYLLGDRTMRFRYGWHIVLSCILLVLYLNILRERPHYADVQDYVQAAFDLRNGHPFHIRYLYPPFLATLCQPFLFLGHDGLAALFWCINWGGFVMYFFLLAKTLEAYGVESRLSGLAVFLFLFVNVPVLRTLSFVQVNFHMMNLILLSVLCYSRHRSLSALMLVVAIHLKASPLVIVLPFIISHDKRWLLSWVVFGCALFAVTYFNFGWAPYESYFANVKTIYFANGISFRENSIDSLVRTLALTVGKNGTALVPFIKIPILVGLIGCVGYSMRTRMWSKRLDALGLIHNSLPILLVVMVFASPLVWEHHFVFLAVPFLLIVRKLTSRAEWVAYGFAYLCVYLMPTFDFYPWSFCRLLGACILVVLCLRLANRGDSLWFEGINQKFMRTGGNFAENEG